MGQGISMGAIIAIADVYVSISFKNCARRELLIKRTTLGRFGGVTIVEGLPMDWRAHPHLLGGSRSYGRLCCLKMWNGERMKILIPC